MKQLIPVLFLLALIGCDNEPPEKTVWDEQLKTIDKAYDAEQEVLNAAERQRQRIEEQTAQ